jgi:predicted XRE-type DNA-binding protein
MEKGEIILYQPNESIQLEVRMESETVWLTQAQMALLFGTQRQAITKHIKNIYDCEELSKKATSSILEQVQNEGNRLVNRKIEYYNLDVIISVGYRVNTKRGIEFRQWANRVLKEYLLHGYAVNQRIERLEQRVTKTEEKIDFFVRTSLPPVEGVFYDGQIFDAHVFVSNLIKSAKQRIILIDNYLDESVLVTLSKREVNVTAKIITKSISNQFQTDLNRYNSQYSPIDVEERDGIHDRFLIIDDTLYHLGASLKDLGKKLFAFSKMEMPPETIL